MTSGDADDPLTAYTHSARMAASAHHPDGASHHNWANVPDAD
jgi:hypothetical protein